MVWASVESFSFILAQKLYLAMIGSFIFNFEVKAIKQVSHVMRKPVFRVSDQSRLKPAASATETS